MPLARKSGYRGYICTELGPQSSSIDGPWAVKNCWRINHMFAADG